MNRAPDFLGDLSDGETGIETQVQGTLFDFSRIAIVRHGISRIKQDGFSPTIGPTRPHYPIDQISSNDAVRGVDTMDAEILTG